VDAAAGTLVDTLSALPDPAVVAAAEERLALPTQVDASTGAEAILVPGRLVGVDVAGGGPHVNGVAVDDGAGRTLSSGDAGAPVAVLERNFASFSDLPDAGDLLVAGREPLRYVGVGTSPEHFLVLSEEGGFFAQANYAVVFTSLETAQALTGRTGRVNDLVVRLAPGADRTAAVAAVEQTFRSRHPELGVTVMDRDDEDAYRLLYDDIEGDQRFWNVFAGLILAGAAFGAFNLAGRMVESQRREIGIGMALGARPALLAARPLLVGLEIALLGALLGVAIGALAVAVLRPVYTTMLPLPVWHTRFQWDVFARGALLGFALPLVATVWPVVRAVRVAPVDAIATTHRSGRSGLSRVVRRLPRPLSAFRRMPIGNVLRAPRRTLLTALGIGAAITTLVGILGLVDSFTTTMERTEDELLQDNPDRLVVALDTFVAVDGAEMTAIADAASVGTVEPVLRVGASIGEVDLLLEIVDLESPTWAPTVARGEPGGAAAGLVLAEKAADDLGVAPGDVVAVEHPARTASGTSVVTTEMPVAGVHPGAFRFNAYLDRSQLAAFGAAGLANEVYVLPGPGSTVDDVERELFALEPVASVQPVAAASRVMRDSLDEFTAVFRAIEGFILVLVLLIAYNATSINADERARERATLFAFGLPVRRIIALEGVEGVLVGILGTGLGLAGGLLVVHWVVTGIAATTMPDMGLDVSLTVPTLVTATVLGIAAVAGAPLLTVRRLRRMDIPGTLRVVE
jgi:putative ABC transport system permease protein